MFGCRVPILSSQLLITFLGIISSSRGSAEFHKCINDRDVAITFDDGPHPTVTLELLQALENYNATATFFINGLYNYETDESRYDRTISEIYRKGHQIGSHAWEHTDLAQQTEAEVTENLNKLARKIQTLLSLNLTVFRPPLGSVNEIVKSVSSKFGYNIILWNVDTRDWETSNIEKSLEAYKNSTENGIIGLHHDTYNHTVDLAIATIEYLRQEGLNIVSIANCIGLEEAYVPHNMSAHFRPAVALLVTLFAAVNYF